MATLKTYEAKFGHAVPNGIWGTVGESGGGCTKMCGSVAGAPSAGPGCASAKAAECYAPGYQSQGQIAGLIVCLPCTCMIFAAAFMCECEPRPAAHVHLELLSMAQCHLELSGMHDVVGVAPRLTMSMALSCLLAQTVGLWLQCAPRQDKSSPPYTAVLPNYWHRCSLHFRRYDIYQRRPIVRATQG